MSEPLVYKPSGFQRHLWKYHKMVDQAAEQSDRVGRDRYEAFSDFSSEVFHRLYAEQPDKLEEPATGADVFVKLHERIDELPEVEDFRQRSKGNERWAGIGTAAVIDTLLDSVPAPEEPVEDLRGDEDVIEYLERLRDKAETDEEREALQETIDEQLDPSNPNGLPARKQRNEQAASMLDDTDVRNAIREAMKKANEQVDAEERLVDAFSFGMEPHSGRKARMAVHKKLASVVNQNSRLKRIAELAGRMRRIAMEQQRQKPQKGTDEVTGVECGDELRKMVPAEALYTDDDIDLVFASKLHERSLLQFEMSKTPKKEQGPIVMVVDSSGSMSAGDADVWAAAVSLAFLEIAYKQKRAFAIVHFGRNVLRVDTFTKWADIDREEVLAAVSFFAADGGTNFMEPLSEAVKKIRDTGAFSEADIVMVTDGNASVDDSWLAQFKAAQRELSFSVYSILVGSYTDADTNKLFSDETVHLDEVLRNDEAMHKFFQRV